jgi:hypothetical protein
VQGRRDVRVFNLADAGHTSRDSWLKYVAVGEARFDLVVFYHGINETRANNVPPELFRDDYSHYAWYAMVNSLSRYHGSARLSLPLTGQFVRMLARPNDGYVPMHEPREEALQYGADIRSARAFGQNLSSIIDLAHQRNDPVMLMTFAMHVPDDYSQDLFSEMRLDYALHSQSMELWGKPENVVAGVDAHNRVVREMTARDETLLFVDQAVLMPRTARYFNDPCHLTAEGAVRFVENLLAGLK